MLRAACNPAGQAVLTTTARQTDCLQEPGTGSVQLTTDVINRYKSVRWTDATVYRTQHETGSVALRLRQQQQQQQQAARALSVHAGDREMHQVNG
jgi:hypothetical protein